MITKQRTKSALALIAAVLSVAALLTAACGDASGESENGGVKVKPVKPNDGGTSAVCADDAAVACQMPGDCPMPDKECFVPTCELGCCGAEMAKKGEPCTGGFCNEQAECVQCLTNANCNIPQPSQCILNECVAQKCGTSFAAEGAACQDHGGNLCDGKGKCVQCLADADCGGGQACYKKYKQCVAPLCANGTVDSSIGETDVDCGGGTCPGCADYEMCLQGSDCLAGVCDKDSKTCGG